jgi:putative radical SAM enzyme (TIGR03279 family)
MDGAEIMTKDHIGGHRIKRVDPDSIAEEIGLESGDILLSINNNKIIDILDYKEHLAGEELTLLVEKKDKSQWEIEIEKEAGEDLGISFDHDLIDKERSCRNKCIFCFIDQLPDNMRSSLYYKDDDWRLSFMMGNYITLTNMDSGDIDRIIEKKISPLYISVHTTNPELRCKMLNNRFAGDALKYLYRLAEAGIKMHCQIVLCPGYNDGQELDSTIKDLWSLYPSVLSTAVVPVGLTKHREGLEPVEPYNKETAGQVIDIVESWQEKLRAVSNIGFIYAADEFYLKAKRELPSLDSYDDFPQLENGVGLTVKFIDEFKGALLSRDGIKARHKRLSIITGKSAEGIIRSLAGKTEEKYGVKVEVIAVENQFFGENVTVAGLVTGKDILSSVKGRSLGDQILLPHVMLRRGEDVFLDDLALESIEKETGLEVKVVQVDGQALVDAILGIDS